MPVNHAANNPVAPVAAPGLTSGTGGSGAARDATSSPFAAMLARHVAEPATGGNSGKKTVSTEKSEPRDADSASQNASLAAVLPMLLNGVPPGVPAATGDAPVAESDKPGKDIPPIGNQVGSGEPILAASAVPIAPIAVAGKGGPQATNDDPSAGQAVSPTGVHPLLVGARTSIAAADTDGQEAGTGSSGTALVQLGLLKSAAEEVPSTGSSAAKSAAIVAASPDVAVARKGDVAQRGFESMLIQADKVRATEGVSQATLVTSPNATDESSVANALEPAVGAIPPHTGASVQTVAVPEYRVATPVGDRHWESAIGNSMVVMTGNRQDRADLVLTPPQLGRIEVSVSMNGDQASATFISANPTVREALENALPRLKEILADAGITLGHAQVGSESLGQSSSNSRNNENLRQNAISDFENRAMQIVATGRDGTTRLTTPRGLIDVFA